MYKRGLGIAIAIIITLSGCIVARPSQSVELGEQVLSDSFDSVGDWDTYDNGDILFEVRGGLFRLDIPAGGYYQSFNHQPHADVILEIDALALSRDSSNGYGVMCRADGNGDGYYFLLGSDGSASIRRGQGRQITPLMAWTKHSAIRGLGQTNTLRAVCVGDYLGLWVNGEFIGETRDSLYRSGMTGIVGVTARAGQRLTVDFDNLRGYIPLTP